MTATTQLREGKYKLIKLELSIPDGRILPLVTYCSRADIYESVLEPTAVAEFIITDKVGIFNHFNFLEQSINIEFTTFEDNPDASVKYTFYPVTVDPAESLPDDKGVVYKLTCVSKEALKSQDMKNIPLVKEKIECETMINGLLQQLKTDKKFFFEKTQGLHAFNFILANPFTNIDQVRLKAMSSEFQGHCFLFYENSKGYHFKSFEGLIKDGLTKIGDKFFTQVAMADTSVDGSKWRNIISFKVIQTGNEGITRALGAGKVLIQVTNVITGEVTPIEIDPIRLDFITLNKNSTSTSLKKATEFSLDISRVETQYYDPTKETSDSAVASARRPYYLKFLFNTVAHITVYGDTAVTIGDVITAKIPEFSGLSLGEDRAYVDTNTTVAGNYLVTKCRHILTFNEGAEYMQALEIVKDGLGGDAPRAKLK